MDIYTKEQGLKNMQAIKITGTKDEVLLAKALWHKGYRYRKNNKKVFGKPDLTFKKHQLAIFVDGEFWHGKDWETYKHRIHSNSEFWYKKIERNIARDKIVNETLTKEGWTVLRFWSKDIRKNTEDCVKKIENRLRKI